jgi:hypothetical protein
MDDAGSSANLPGHHGMMMMPLGGPSSAPHTPPQMQLLYDSQLPKVDPTRDATMNGAVLGDFHFGQHHSLDFGHGGGLMIDANPQHYIHGQQHEDFEPDTPSLGTEASFMSEEGMSMPPPPQQQMLMAGGSREATSFPAGEC